MSYIGLITLIFLFTVCQLDGVKEKVKGANGKNTPWYLKVCITGVQGVRGLLVLREF